MIRSHGAQRRIRWVPNTGERVMSEAILRLPLVKSRTGLSRSTIYLRVKKGTFPKPVNLGARAVGWIESEVDDWLEQQIKQSRQAA